MLKNAHQVVNEKLTCFNQKLENFNCVTAVDKSTSRSGGSERISSNSTVRNGALDIDIRLYVSRITAANGGVFGILEIKVAAVP